MSSNAVRSPDSTRNLRRGWRSFGPNLLILPALLPLILLILLPAIRTVVMSFHDVTHGFDDVYVGFANYIAMVSHRAFNTAFLNTLIFSFSTVAGEVLIGLAVAVLVSTRFRAQRLLISLIMVPYAVSEVVAVIIWRYMLEPDIGIINFVLTRFLGMGQVQWATELYQTWILIILLRVWVQFPFSFLIIYSSLIGIPQELHESAHIDGASNWKAFTNISLPLISPAIVIASIFAFVFAFRNFATVWVLTRGGPIGRTELLSTMLYKQAFRHWQFGLASAIAVVMTVLTFLISAYYLRSMFKGMFGQRR